MKSRISLLLSTAIIFTSSSRINELSVMIDDLFEKEKVSLAELYKDLHQSPELSLRETETAKKMARELKNAGFEVTEGVGGTGVVGILKNGSGPTVLIRTDMDALPMLEKADVNYASKVRTNNVDGNEVGVMHSCGHDMHMTVWTGTARMLSELKNQWKGTLMMIGQPAEEIGQGAFNMLQDGLFERFPVPDYGLALHMNPELPVGQVGLKEGYTLANTDMVDITIYGEGGHGAAPHLTVDPIVLASLYIMEIQTLVSRNINPIESAVITVGAINGGTKHNIIPDHVGLQLTIRTYKTEIRQQILEGLMRIGKGLAISAGLGEEKYPTMKVRDNYTPANYNDPGLVSFLHGSMSNSVGEDNIIETDPAMVGEDFARYGHTEHDIPTVLYWLGSSSPERLASFNDEGKKIPGLHSPYFQIDIEPAIETGVKSMTTSVIDLMNRSKEAKN